MKITKVLSILCVTLLVAGCSKGNKKDIVTDPFLIEYNGGTVDNNSKITVTKVNEANQNVVCDLNVKNTSGKQISVKVTKSVPKTNTIANAADINLMCFGICVGAATQTLTADVAANAAELFTGDLETATLAVGKSSVDVEYVFEDVATKFSRTVVVTYNYTKK